MDNRVKYAIIGIVLVVLAIYAILAFNSTYNAKVGTSSVSIPDGYEVANTTDNSSTIKDDKTTFTVSVLNKGQSIDQVIDLYKEMHQDQTIKDYNKKIGDVNIKGVILQDSETNKTVDYNYFYEKNYKTYHIYEKGKHNQTALETIIKQQQSIQYHLYKNYP